MYNDYYLQQIDNKLDTTNNNLNTIITNQQTLISGDIYIKQELEEIKFYNKQIWAIMIGVEIGIILGIIYNFITRSLR